MYYMVIESDNTVKQPLLCTIQNLKDYGFEEDDFKRVRRISYC